MKYIKYDIKENELNLSSHDLFYGYRGGRTMFGNLGCIWSIIPIWLSDMYGDECDNDKLVYCRLIRVSDDYLWVVFNMTWEEVRYMIKCIIEQPNINDEFIENLIVGMML